MTNQGSDQFAEREWANNSPTPCGNSAQMGGSQIPKASKGPIEDIGPLELRHTGQCCRGELFAYQRLSSVRANSQNRRTTAAVFFRAKANPISDSGSRSAIEHTATLETILFVIDAGTIETPTPASTREMSVGISTAVWTTLGTTPALLRIPVK